MDSNKEIPGTAERPVAPPRSKSKSSKGSIEAGPQKDHTTKAPKLDAPNRIDMNLPLTVKPKPTPARNELREERRVSPSVSGNESVVVTDASIEDITSDAKDIQTGQKEIKRSEVEPSKAKAKKPVPPPIPRRIDLDWLFIQSQLQLGLSTESRCLCALGIRGHGTVVDMECYWGCLLRRCVCILAEYVTGTFTITNFLSFAFSTIGRVVHFACLPWSGGLQEVFALPLLLRVLPRRRWNRQTWENHQNAFVTASFKYCLSRHSSVLFEIACCCLDSATLYKYQVFISFFFWS